MQYVDAGDISELVAGFSSICLQRQNKGVACEIEYSTCFFADKELFECKYLSTNKISGTGISSCVFSTHMFYDSSFMVYRDTYSNQNIFADSLVLESMWNNHDVSRYTDTDIYVSVFINQ